MFVLPLNITWDSYNFSDLNVSTMAWMSRIVECFSKLEPFLSFWVFCLILQRGTKEDASSRSESQTTADEDFGFRWTSEPINPNKLSEEMVRCMAKIFCHLGMPSNNARMLLQSNQSPTSHLGNQVIESSSLSSVSDSSSLSPPAFAHSPILGLQKQENNIMATDAATTTPSDLYKSRGKLSYADVGPYNHVLEVRWLSVSREQLKYAAQGLAKYRLGFFSPAALISPESSSDFHSSLVSISFVNFKFFFFGVLGWQIVGGETAKCGSTEDVS